MSNILIRAITGATFVLIIVASILIGSIGFYITFSVITIISLFEFYNLSDLALANTQKLLGIFTGWLFFTFTFLNVSNFVQLKFIIVFIPIILLFFINELYLYHKKPLKSIAFTILGLVYVAIPFSFLNYFVFRTNITAYNADDITNYEYIINQSNSSSLTYYYTPYILLAFFSLIWLYDTFAYLIGITIGKHKLFERISPKKSWEGAIGGGLVTIAISTLFPLIFKQYEWYQWVIFSFILIVFSTFGDLVESMFKRSLNIKDSGKLLPGHGGMLDRFDSVLLSAPVIYIYLQFIN